MAELSFEWSEAKSRANAKKHGITFEEARTVFLDEFGLFMEDEDHSESEDRFLLLGVSSRLRTLVVCHCFRESDSVIRIISARRATRKEREQYAARLR